MPLWIGDDDLAELDEAFALVLEDVRGATLLGTAEVRLVILDDDRSAVIDARSVYGFVPGSERDSSAALQSALDQASAAGRGV